MTIHEVIKVCDEAAAGRDPRIREGQAWMNKLLEIFEEGYDHLFAGDLDPFYVDSRLEEAKVELIRSFGV